MTFYLGTCHLHLHDYHHNHLRYTLLYLCVITCTWFLKPEVWDRPQSTIPIKVVRISLFRYGNFYKQIQYIFTGNSDYIKTYLLESLSVPRLLTILWMKESDSFESSNFFLLSSENSGCHKRNMIPTNALVRRVNPDSRAGLSPNIGGSHFQELKHCITKSAPLMFNHNKLHVRKNLDSIRSTKNTQVEQYVRRVQKGKLESTR